MTTLARALDALLDGPAATPRPNSDADRLTGAATALLAISRVLPTDARVLDATIDPGTGRLTLQLDDADDAAQLGYRLGLPKAALVVDVEHGHSAHRWAGRWADWPVVLLHLSRTHSATPAAIEARP